MTIKMQECSIIYTLIPGNTTGGKLIIQVCYTPSPDVLIASMFRVLTPSWTQSRSSRMMPLDILLS